MGTAPLLRIETPIEGQIRPRWSMIYRKLRPKKWTIYISVIYRLIMYSRDDVIVLTNLDKFLS